MNNSPSIRYAHPAPYPPVQVSAQNPAYARQMLSNIGSANSEMSAISLYLYNAQVTGCAFEEVSSCFYQIGMVEMHHLDIFGKLALKLGADPRLWSWQNRQRVYWNAWIQSVSAGNQGSADQCHHRRESRHPKISEPDRLHRGSGYRGEPQADPSR